MVLKQLNIPNNLDTDGTPLTKIISKCITGLNARCKTTKLLEDNIGEKLGKLGYGNDILDTAPKAQSMKEVTGTTQFKKGRKT